MFALPPSAATASAVDVSTPSELRTSSQTLYSSGRTRIVIADNHRPVRRRFRDLLSLQPDFLVVGESTNEAEVIGLVRELRPDVLFLDYPAATPSTVGLARNVRALCPGVRMIVRAPAINHGLETALLREGVWGILQKASSPAMMLKCVRKVHEGELWARHESIAKVVAALFEPGSASRTDPTPARDFGLTARENEVLRLVVEGETNKGIATRLTLGQVTVKHHLTNIFNKTGASTRLELALFALHHRMIRIT